MAHNIFRRGGIPALASLSLSDSSLCACSLVVKTHEAHRQATIVLQFDLFLYGFDGLQNISLVYDADNLVPGAIAIRRAKVSPPQDLLRQIARHEGRDLRTLSLVMKRPCTVRCPRSSGSIAPKNSYDPRFTQLVNLAKSTSLDIVFDYAWLHPTKSAQFLSLINHPERLTGFCADNAAILLRVTDWTVFSPDDQAPPEEPPPSYADTSHKRHRRSATSSPQPPTSKRLLLDLSVEIAPPSPTEKATTTTASPSPRRLPSSPLVNAFDIQLKEAVENAVATLLPDALQAVLPDVLTRVLAVPKSLPSPSSKISALTQNTGPSNTNSTSKPHCHPMSPLHDLILTHLTTHADELAQQITADAFEHANDLRNTADVELQEHLDDHKAEFTILKEDGLMEFDRLCDAKLEALREHAAELVEGVEDKAQDVYVDVREKLDDLVGQRRTEMAKLERDYGPVSSRNKDRDRDRRATSLPLGL